MAGAIRLAGAREVRVGCPLPRRADHAFTTIILNLNLFELFFFCPASQLHFGAEGAQEPI